MSLKKYFALSKITFIENYSYFWNIITRGVFVSILLFIFVHIWQAIYAGKTSIGGFTINEMMWYLAFAESITLSAGANRIEKLGDEIRDGSLANSLLKPWSFLGREFSLFIATFASSFILVGAVSFLVTYLLIGGISISFYSIPFIVIALVAGVTINFMITTSLGTLSLWLEDTSALYWIYQKIVFIFGGMLLPLSFYPDWIQNFVKYLPTTFFMYWPSRLFVHFSIEDFVYAIGWQIGWIIVLGIITYIIYLIGIRKVCIYGG